MNNDASIKVGKFRLAQQKISNQKTLLLMLLPGLIFMIIFNYIPMAGIVIAFKNFRIYQSFSEAPWAGLDHFIDFFQGEDFFVIMRNTLGINLIRLVIGFPLPIMFAIMLNELKMNVFKRHIQTISYLPHFISWVVLGGILINWMAPEGFINDILIGLGMLKEPIAFLAYPKYFWGIAVISDIWKELGWSAIIYLAAIAGIDPTMYEVATIDGATRFQKIRSITIPTIAPTIAMMFIIAVSFSLSSNFEQVLVLNNQLNNKASEVLDLHVFREGIRMSRYSYATAVGLFKSVVSFILLFIANKVSKVLTGNSLF